MAKRSVAPIPKTHERTPGPRGQDTKGNNELFLKEVFNTTNKYRAMHGCPALTLNAEPNKLAQEWANVEYDLLCYNIYLTNNLINIFN